MLSIESPSRKVQDQSVSEADARQLASGAGHKLEVRDVCKSYGLRDGRELTVLDGINLSLQAREFVCLVGASGCGKSTLLNIVAGLANPSYGKVLVDGRCVTGRPGSDRGMVFQGYTLYPWLTVAQNIAFGLRFRKLSKSQRAERVHYFLNVVGLAKFAQAYPKQLSGGMKQRVAIARALANEPAMLLMDEPFGALDAQTKEQMQQFLLQLWEQTHVTVLMITHDVEEAIYLSQRVYVMDAHPGRIQTEVAIPLPEHRSLDIKLSPEFVEIKRSILHALRGDQTPLE
jgi:NitT/TauT family transport system ATP-binding protein